jgi:hypothetical protein
MPRQYITKPIKERFENFITMEPNTGCWLWTGTTHRKGYGRFNVTCKYPRNAHRVSWELYHGPIPRGMLVLHHCDTRSCVNPKHLFLGTPWDNTHDAINKNRLAKGEQHGHAKLTKEEVLAIREDTRLQRIIAIEYKVGPATISAIKLHNTWKHI